MNSPVCPLTVFADAGAIVVGNRGTYESKQKALQAAGVTVLATPSDVGGALKERLGR